MIRTPEVARAVIQAAKRGAQSEAGGIPVSVKTRLGYHTDQVEEWIPVVLAEAPAALTIHARTRKEMSKVPARWERLARIVELRDQLSPMTKIIGNGDILSAADGRQKAIEYDVDGAMVGRALFGNPWFFHPTKRLPVKLTALPTHGVSRDTIETVANAVAGEELVTMAERLTVLVEHTNLFCTLLPHKNFAVMKKHYKAYVSGWPGAAELRHVLMEAPSPTAVAAIVADYLAVHKVP
jgi:tRNA-dihydrouridine synthase